MFDTIDTQNFNDWARRAYIAAPESAKRTNHRVTGTQHLLLALLEPGSVANLLMRSFHLTKLGVFEIIKGMPKPVPKGLGEAYLYTDGFKQVLDKSRKLAQEYPFRHAKVYSDHLLAALLVVNDEPLAYVLRQLGVDTKLLLAQALEQLERKRNMANP